MIYTIHGIHLRYIYILFFTQFGSPSPHNMKDSRISGPKLQNLVFVLADFNMRGAPPCIDRFGIDGQKMTNMDHHVKRQESYECAGYYCITLTFCIILWYFQFWMKF